MSIAIVDHHTIGLYHQHPGRRVILVGWRRTRLLDELQRLALAAFYRRRNLSTTSRWA